MNCEHCGAMLNAGDTACGICGTPVSSTPVAKAVQEKVGMGILGALIGALIGGASIVLLSRLGYVAAISGFITAFATLKGYELLGKKLSKTGIIVSIVLMILTPFLAYNVDLVLQLQAELQSYGMTIADTISFLVELVLTDSEMMQAYLSDLGMIYLFTAIGTFGILRNTLRKA